MTKTHALLQRWFKKYRACKSGGVLIYIAFGLPILLGAMALSIDLGRAFILNTELKDFSDAAALAGAAELDGRPGAMVAAEAAARTGISGNLINVQTFATDGSGSNIQVDQVVFLKNLPADGTDFVAADTATTDAEARFIFVSVVDRNVTSGLSRALGVIPDFQTTAKSIAGFSSLTCRIPPIFMCNPLEGDGTSDSTGTYPQFPVSDLPGCSESDTYPGAPLKEECLTGRQLLAKNVGQDSEYSPGNFGLLDPQSCGNKGTNQGANCVGEQLATFAPDFCVADTVDFRTGEAIGPVRRGINVRFDMFDQNFSGQTGNPNYPPALNVTKGYTGSGCGSAQTDPPVAHPLPRDSCLATDPGTCADGRYGDGNWYNPIDLDGDPNTPPVEPYWAINHPGVPEPTASDGPFFKDYQDMTRYEIYRYEIETGLPNNIPNNSPSGENGNPQCYSGPTPSPDPSIDPDDVGVDEIDRRVLPMAAVNCRQVQLDGMSLSGNTNDVPIVGLIRVFITEPIAEPGGGPGSSHQADIFVELAGVLDPGEAEEFRDVVQLYR